MTGLTFLEYKSRAVRTVRAFLFAKIRFFKQRSSDRMFPPFSHRYISVRCKHFDVL